MKIAFDIDETYTKDPEVFGRLIKLLQNAGHQVGALSIREAQDLPLEDWDFTICFDDNVKKIMQSDGVKSEEDAVRGWKSRMITEHNIDLHFDDMADYFDDAVKDRVVKV